MTPASTHRSVTPVMSPHQGLAGRALLSGKAFSYFAQAEGLPLSLKCMFNGRARYKLGRHEFCVDHAGYMIVNESQPYTVEIASPTIVQSFILWFPHGWAEEVGRSLQQPIDTLMSEPESPAGLSARFVERYVPHDRFVTPAVLKMLAAYNSGAAIEDFWLEERLREVLAGMLQTQRHYQRSVDNIRAARTTTRAELGRRLYRGRDFLRARASDAVSLSDAAKIACLSPYHFLRSFKHLFGVTPHQYLTQCRLDRAKFLLEHTALPVTDVCLDAGFVSLGSFSALFHRLTGLSPRAWRSRHPRSRSENRKIREVFLAGRA